MARTRIPFVFTIGQRFGRWTILDPTLDRSGTNALVLCHCDCGAERMVAARRLREGLSQSCGCLQRDCAHGPFDRFEQRFPEEHGIWMGMHARCRCPTNRAYPNYGERGIAVCERWDSFANFYADLGPRPSSAHSIDRIDNDGGYWCGQTSCSDCGPAARAPNCRWATRAEQRRNCRRVHAIAFRGRTMCLSDWAIEIGLSRGALEARLLDLGWSVEKALTTPNRHRDKGGRQWFEPLKPIK